MDDIDRRLLILLGGSPRMHFQDIARQLRISKQAVHHRVHLLMEGGVIRKATAHLSVSYLDAIPVAVMSRSRTKSVARTLDRLGGSEFTRRVNVAGGNYMYVTGFLRDISELDGYVEFVEKEAEMLQPTVGIFCLDDGLMPYYTVDGGGSGKRIHAPLTPLDLKIVAALREDARMPVADVAKTVGSSAKTVRRHLDDMVSDGSLEFQFPMDLARMGDLLFLAELQLRDGADKRAVGRKLLAGHSFRDQYIRTFSNIPDFLLWIFWSNDIPYMRRVLDIANECEEVLSVTPNFIYLERLYPTWRDKLVDLRQLPDWKAKKARKNSSRS